MRSGLTVYQALCLTLNELSALDVFFVFLSTSSKLLDHTRLSSWYENANSRGAYVRTLFNELPFNIWKELHLVSEGVHTIDDVCLVDFMVRFSRPL